MRALLPLWLAFCLAASLQSALAAETESLDPHLEPLRPLLGKTWRGEFKNSTSEKPVVDVSRWERALNGKAVRMLHSINDGVYGGESLFTWDEEKQAVIYYYFTTAGFMTTGTMKFEGGKMLSREQIKGNAGGIAEVRGTSEIRDGALHVKTEHLKDGSWSPGHEVVYREHPGGTVVFK